MQQKSHYASESSFHPSSHFLLSDHQGSEIVGPQEETIPASHLAILGNPRYWACSWQALSKISVHSLLPILILDFYLLARYLDSSRGCGDPEAYHCHYLNVTTIQRLLKVQVPEAELRTEPSLPFLKELGLPIKPVFLLLDVSPIVDYEEPVLLILNYEVGKIIILDPRDHYQEDTNKIWTSVAQIFRWKLTCVIPSVHREKWIKGYETFGPDASFLVDSMLDGKWTWEDIEVGWGMLGQPELLCEKVQRQRIFFSTIEFCRTYGDHWKNLNRQYSHTWDTIDQTVAQEVRTGFLNFYWVKHEGLRHVRAVDYCNCKRNHICDNSSMQVTEIEDNMSGDVGDKEIPSDEPPEQIHHAVFNMHCFGDEEDEEEDDETDPPLGSVAYDPHYDDYASAPLNKGAGLRQQPGVWIVNRDGVRMLDNCWSHWKDRGYRLHPTFFRTIHSEANINAHATILPSIHMDTTAYCFSETWKDPTVLELSGQDMIDEAGHGDRSIESQRVFIKGIERAPGATLANTKLIGLNLEKDSVALLPDIVDISIDLDSLIWITPALSFSMQSLVLHLAPSNLSGPAFAINNFVYVNIMHPPTNQEELAQPQHRRHGDIPLSRIPNVELGHVGDGVKRINVYAFFPRMIGKHTQSNRYSTLLPSPLQTLWFDTVIKACREGFSDTMAPGLDEYMPAGLEELRNRAGSHMMKQTMLLAKSATIRTIINKVIGFITTDSNLLSQFGSFFIVADGRGMKIATKQCIQEGNLTAGESQSTMEFALIKEQFSDLDWDGMLDPNKGTLYLDLGISFHPPSEEPLVGLWRLEKLQTSFREMGMKKGRTHHFNTLAFYGGMKAEMKAKLKQESQLISRLSYCLVFELVRTPGTKDYLCPDRDIINCSDRFRKACDSWLSLFKGAITRSYGVREEIRGVGATIINTLPLVIPKAREYLISNPILWMKSSTFFKLITHRFSALMVLHRKAYEKRSLNYRLSALIYGHLMRYVMVTPPSRSDALTAALRDLRFEEVMMSYGYFAMHNIRLSDASILDIDKEDPQTLQKSYKLMTHKPIPIPTTAHLLPHAATNAYPWGEFLTMERLEDLLNRNASQFLREPDVLDMGSLKHPDSAQIFMAFCQQIWVLFTHGITSEETFEGLEDAMEMWSYKNLNSLAISIHLLPAYEGLLTQGGPKLPKTLSFLEARNLFFPAKNSAGNHPCKSFATLTIGYLQQYYEALDGSTSSAINDLNNDLDQIFELLQCLPASTQERGRPVIWRYSSDNDVLFVANPKYYRVRGVCTNPAAQKKSHKPRAQNTMQSTQKLLHELWYGPGTYRSFNKAQAPKKVKDRSRKGATAKKQIAKKQIIINAKNRLIMKVQKPGRHRKQKKASSPPTTHDTEDKNVGDGSEDSSDGDTDAE